MGALDQLGDHRGRSSRPIALNSNTSGQVDISYTWGKDGMVPVALAVGAVGSQPQ